MNLQLSYFQKMVTIFVVMAPILLPYGINGISLALLAQTLLILYSIVSLNFKSSYLKEPYLIFIIYANIIVNIVSIINGGIGTIYKQEILLYLLLCITNYNFDLTYGKKVYKILIYISCAVFFLQEASAYILGTRFSGLIPFLPIVYDQGFAGLEGTISAYMEWQETWNRSSSIFLEPAQFAQFIIPYFALRLFSKESFKFDFEVLCLILIFILLRSGNGLIILGLLLFLWIYNMKKTKIEKIKISISCLLIFFILSFFINTEIGQELLSRSNEFNSSNKDSSAFERIFRGYYLFENLNLSNQIFGINQDTLLQKMLFLPSYIKEMFHNEVYLNTFQNKLIYTGCIGVIIYSYWIYQKSKMASSTGKYLILAMIALHFFASLNPIFILLYLNLSSHDKNNYLTINANHNKNENYSNK